MSDAPLVLVIDDEPHIRRAVRDALRDVSERIAEAATGAQAIAEVEAHPPQLVLLDLGLPDLAGTAVCQEIRRRSAVPIIVLSARHAESEKVELLEAGADDYVTKPFSVLELSARVRAQLRRANRLSAHPPGGTITVAHLTVDRVGRRIVRAGEAVHLTPIEWQIFATLLDGGGRTLTHQQIFDAVWGRQYGSPRQYLRVHITNLRRKIELDPAAPEVIVTEPGVGYRLEVATGAGGGGGGR